jgi:hypothetical protein
MKRTCVLLFLGAFAIVCQLSFAQEQGKEKSVENIVRRFVSPGSSITQLVTHVDPKTGQGQKFAPAIVSAPLEGRSEDIAFAETTKLDEGKQVLTVAILKPNQNEYVKVFTKTYYDRVMFGQDFKTIGFNSVRLSTDADGLLILTSTGAALGGDLEIFAWKDGLGFVNVVPPKVNGGHQFTWNNEDGVLVVHISYRKSETDTAAPPSTTLRWSAEAGAMVVVP